MHETTDEHKLTVVLQHWMEHNRGHVQEFEKWAEKAKASGHEKVSECILEAAQQMDKANEVLDVALSALSDSGDS